MIKFCNVNENCVFPDDTINMGLLESEYGKFRGFYLKFIKPKIERHEVISYATYKMINTDCKNHTIILVKFKPIKFESQFEFKYHNFWAEL